MQPPIIAANPRQAIKIAKYTIRYTNKAFRLKNVVVLNTTITYKTFTLPAIKLTADTNMQEDVEVTIGISKAHANIQVPKCYEQRKYKTKKQL